MLFSCFRFLIIAINKLFKNFVFFVPFRSQPQLPRSVQEGPEHAASRVARHGEMAVQHSIRTVRLPARWSFGNRRLAQFHSISFMFKDDGFLSQVASYPFDNKAHNGRTYTIS